MKIRTFISCENVSVDKEKNTITIQTMLAGLYASHFPHKENVVIIMTFDEVEEKAKKLEITLLSPKDKPVDTWVKNLESLHKSIAVKLPIQFLEEGIYHFRVGCDGEFLGKYPFSMRKKEEVREK